ncbi:hypothetical protein ACIPPQ_20040 [Sphingopyxis sp. LARHCG72]
MEYLIAFVVGYFVVLASLSLVARPARLRLKRTGGALLAEYAHDEMITGYIRDQLGTAYSWRAAAIDSFVLIAALIVPTGAFWDKAQRVESEHPEMFTDKRFAEFERDYNVSIVAVNPIFGALMLIAGMILTVKVMTYRRSANVRHHIPPVGFLNPA